MSDTNGVEVKVAGPPAAMIEEYIALRDGKKKAEEVLKVWFEENFGRRMEELENALLHQLNELGANSLASPAGTAYKKLSTSVTVADTREFRRHVIGSELWDLIEWRPMKSTVNDLVDSGEPLPPGLNRNVTVTVGIRRKSE